MASVFLTASCRQSIWILPITDDAPTDARRFASLKLSPQVITSYEYDTHTRRRCSPENSAKPTGVTSQVHPLKFHSSGPKTNLCGTQQIILSGYKLSLGPNIDDLSVVQPGLSNFRRSSVRYGSNQWNRRPSLMQL